MRIPLSGWISSLMTYLRGVLEEIGRVRWPHRAEVISGTVLVVIVVIIATILFGLVDYLLSRGLEVLLEIRGR